MAELSPNFINPDYASPAQIAQLRAYARALQEKAISGEAKTPMGAIAAALMGFQGSREMGKANEQEQAARRAYTKQLMEAGEEFKKTKDPTALLGALANPNADPLQAYFLKSLMEARPSQRFTAGGAAAEMPSPSVYEEAAGAGVKPVSQGRTLPPTTQGPAVAPPPVPPSKQNLTEGNITGVNVQNIPPGMPAVASSAPAPNIPGMPPKAAATLGGLANYSTELKTQETQQDTANKENMGVIAKRPVAEQRMANVKLLKDISDHIDDPAVIAKLKQKATDLGIPVGKTTNQYEIFSSVTKRLAYQELQEAAASGRIPPYALDQYSAANAQLWNTPQARTTILNTVASPLDHDIRRAKYANKYLANTDPFALWQKHTALPVDPTPLSRPKPPQTAIDDVRKNPKLLPDFVGAYGPGAAEDLGIQ